MNISKYSILSLAAASMCFGQAQTPTYPNQPVSANDPSTLQIWTSNLGTNPVGVGDLIFVSISGSPDLSRSFRVDPSGSITMGLSHKAIHVAGLTPDKIADAVADDLKAEQILVAPIVSVSVLDYRSRQVVVSGSVRTPGVVQDLGALTVSEAIAKSQGLMPEAGPDAIVTRGPSGPDAGQVIRVPLKKVLSGADPELNVQVHGGDRIDVPEAPKVYLVGNLKLPGIYPLTESGGTTVMKALAMSQGQLPFTTKEAYIYRDVNGERKEIPVPLRKILKRDAPDVALLANDILYVPENGARHATAAVLDRLAGFGTSVGSGLLVYGKY